MKVRLGFVSNSSTTSFCIWGFCDDASNVKDMLLKMKANIQDDDDFIDDIHTITESAGMDCYTHPYSDTAYIGFEMSSIPDNMTAGDWKKEKTAEIQKVFGKDIKCSVVEDGWRDG